VRHGSERAKDEPPLTDTADTQGFICGHLRNPVLPKSRLFGGFLVFKGGHLRFGAAVKQAKP